MSATNLYINWSGVTFTPSGGSATTITKVTRVKFDSAGKPEMFKGDAARFTQDVAVPDQSRTVEIDTGDVGSMIGVAIGDVGTLVAKLNDAHNGITVGGGGKLYTLSNAVYLGDGADGAHGKYASGTIRFEAFAPDGATDPLAITEL